MENNQERTQNSGPCKMLLKKNLGIDWKDRVKNEDLWNFTGKEPLVSQIVRRNWRWIRHTLQKPSNNVTQQALFWDTQGKKNIGQPRNSLRDVER